MENSVRIKPPVPPHNDDLELRVIAALIQIGEPNLRVQKAMLQLDVNCFFSMQVRELYEIFKKLFEEQKDFNQIDFMSHIPEHLYQYSLTLFGDSYCTTNLLEADIEKLFEFRIYRKYLKILVDAVNLSLDATTNEESIAVITEHLQKIVHSGSTIRKAYARTYETIADEYLSESCTDSSEIKIDIADLPPVPNRALITIAGRSGHGKTFFALHLMDKIIDSIPDKQSLYFNLEMHERVMLERHAKLLGTKGDTRKEIILNGIPKLLTKNVSVVSEPLITIDEIEIQCRLAALQQPIAVIVVDYLGLIRTKAKSDKKYLDQSDIAQRLAGLSLELDCIVIALIQVNRDFKVRSIVDRCPKPEDSAESMGSVHSSSWWLGINQPQNDCDDPEYKDLFTIHCRKNRGESGLFKLNLKFKDGMFTKYDRPYQQNYVKPKNVTEMAF